MRALGLSLLVLAACQAPLPARVPPPASGGSGTIDGRGGSGGGAGGDPEPPALVAGPEEDWEPLPDVTGVPPRGPEVCRPDGWCWTRPLPTGMPLAAGAASHAEVWLGGPGELLRFDGLWQSWAWSFDMDVRAISTSLTGRWVSVAAGAEVAAFDGTTFRRWATPPGALAVDVALVAGQTFLVLREGDRGELWQLAGGRFRRVDHERGLSITSVASLNDDVAVGSTEGLLERRNGWHVTLASPVRDLCFTLEGTLAMALAAGSVRIRDAGGAWSRISDEVVDELVCGTEISMRTTRGAWLVSDGFTIRKDVLRAPDRVLADGGRRWTYRGGRLLADDASAGTLPGIRPVALATAPDGTVWAAGSGASRFDVHEGWTAPVRADATFDAIVAGPEGVFAAAPDRVVRLDANERDLELRRPALGRDPLRAAGQDRLLRRSGDAWIDDDPPLQGEPVALLGTDAALLAIVDTREDSELRARSGGEWTRVASFPRGTYRTLLPSRAGVLLGDGGALDPLGRTRGGRISILDEGRLRHPTFPGALASVPIALAAGDDELWIAAAGDVLHGTREGWAAFLVPGVRQVRRSPRGEAWIVGDAGRALRGPDLEPVATGVATRLNAVAFTGGEVVVAGDAGVLLRGDAAGLAPIATGADLDLLAVAVVDGHTFVGAVGVDGGSGLFELGRTGLTPQGRASVVLDLLAVDGEVFGVGRPYLVRWAEGLWERPTVRVDALAGNAADDLWLATPDYGLRHWKGGAYESRGVLTKGPLAVSPRGTLWATDDDGLRAMVELAPVADELAPWRSPAGGLVAVSGGGGAAVIAAPPGTPGPDRLVALDGLEPSIGERVPCVTQSFTIDAEGRPWIACARMPGAIAVDGPVLHRR